MAVIIEDEIKLKCFSEKIKEILKPLGFEVRSDDYENEYFVYPPQITNIKFYIFDFYMKIVINNKMNIEFISNITTKDIIEEVLYSILRYANEPTKRSYASDFI